MTIIWTDYWIVWNHSLVLIWTGNLVLYDCCDLQFEHYLSELYVWAIEVQFKLVQCLLIYDYQFIIFDDAITFDDCMIDAFAHCTAYYQSRWRIWSPNLSWAMGNPWDHTSREGYICTWKCWVFNFWCTTSHGGKLERLYLIIFFIYDNAADFLKNFFIFLYRLKRLVMELGS